MLERLENTHCTVFYRAHLQFKNPCLWLEMAKYHCFQQCHSNGCKMSATVYSGLWHITQTTREMFEWENRCVSLFREASTKNNCSFYNSYWNKGHKRKAVFSSGNEASTRIQPHSALKGLKVWFHLVTIVWWIFAGEIKSFHYWEYRLQISQRIHTHFDQ